MNRKSTPDLTPSLRLFCLAVCLALSAQGRAAAEELKEGESPFPATEAGAKTLLQEWVKPGANVAALSRWLHPAPADYAAVFELDFSAKAAALYDPVWDSGKMLIAPKAGQSEVKVFFTTSDEMKSWTGTAKEFAEGWKQVAPKLKPGLKIYRFNFVEPGKDSGMAFDGLIYVNGNWRIFPKPWRALEKEK